MTARLFGVRLAVGFLTALTTGCLGPPQQKGKWIHDYEPLSDAFGYVIELEQGWTDVTQQSFYNTPQGSQIMPYSWILALEQAGGETRFIEPENIERYRYISRKASSGNPDALPVGWTKGRDSAGKDWFGLSCSACHTAQIEYVIPGTKQLMAIRIDGAPTSADFSLMNLELVAALQRTVSDTVKFDRFAAAVLPKGASDNAKAALKGEIRSQADALDTRNSINHTDVAYGFGRIDAIGFIFNQVMSTLPGMPQNAKPSDAPASYPFLWGTDQSSVVQWTGFSANASGVGVLIRNGGEVIGVYGKVQLSDSKTYASSLLIENLGRLENWVRELNSPKWPQDVFPRIDAAKAAKGEVLYAVRCAQCHQVIPRDKAIETAYKAVITPIDELGTDPGELNNLGRMYEAGLFAGKKVAVIAGDEIPDPTTGLDPLINSVVGALLHHPEETLRSLLKEHATHSLSSANNNGYKGRPLNGIWATAPYLHNGSVPNLYEILLSPEQRSKTFVLGSRMYDPIRVGYAMDQSSTTGAGYRPFTFDTSLKGNSNVGHEYGTRKPADGGLTEEQRWQLVEYMKTL